MGKQRKVITENSRYKQDTLTDAIKIMEGNPLFMATHLWFKTYVEPERARRRLETGKKISETKKKKKKLVK